MTSSSQPSSVDLVATGPHSEIVAITADVARLMLRSNTSNRKLNASAVRRMAGEMLANRWRISTDMVGFDVQGRLVNGQHRLHAVLMASEQDPDIAINMSVMYGLPMETFDVVDQGMTRSLGQILNLHGITNATAIGVAARNVIRYDLLPGTIWATANDVPKTQVTDYVLTHYERWATVSQGSEAAAHRAHLNKTTLMSLKYLVLRDSTRDESRWETFEQGIATGADLSAGDPRLALRNGTFAYTWGSNGAQPRLGAFIKAWNAWAQDKSVRLLRFSRNELPMPKVL